MKKRIKVTISGFLGEESISTVIDEKQYEYLIEQMATYGVTDISLQGEDFRVVNFEILTNKTGD